MRRLPLWAQITLGILVAYLLLVWICPFLWGVLQALLFGPT